MQCIKIEPATKAPAGQLPPLSCPYRKPRPAGEWVRIGRCCCPMWDFCRLTWWALVGLFRSRRALEAEILVLRQQINVLRRTAPKRLLISSIDRLILVGLYRLFPDVRGALTIVKPDTVIRWHRAGFRAYWRWKSRTRGGRPRVPPEIRQLIRDMSLANPLWGAPRIHGELLKLGIDVGQTTVAKYMARRRRGDSSLRRRIATRREPVLTNCTYLAAITGRRSL